MNVRAPELALTGLPSILVSILDLFILSVYVISIGLLTGEMSHNFERCRCKIF